MVVVGAVEIPHTQDFSEFIDSCSGSKLFLIHIYFPDSRSCNSLFKCSV